MARLDANDWKILINVVTLFRNFYNEMVILNFFVNFLFS